MEIKVSRDISFSYDKYSCNCKKKKEKKGRILSNDSIFFFFYSLSSKNLIKRTSRLTSTKCNIFPIKMIFREIYSNVFPVINSLVLVVFSILFNVQSRTRAHCLLNISILQMFTEPGPFFVACEISWIIKGNSWSNANFQRDLRY